MTLSVTQRGGGERRHGSEPKELLSRRRGIMPTTATEHIHLDKRGVAWIDDTNTKVVEVVLDKLAYGSSPEEIHFQHPHLSLAQIHAALSYTYCMPLF
jgi:uncharacterized protein (DUF433 family)